MTMYVESSRQRIVHLKTDLTTDRARDAERHFRIQRPRLPHKRVLGHVGRAITLLWRLLPGTRIRHELASGESRKPLPCECLSLFMTAPLTSPGFVDRKRRYAPCPHHQNRGRTDRPVVAPFGPSDRPRQTYRHGLDDGRLEPIGRIDRDRRTSCVHTPSFLSLPSRFSLADHA